MAQALERVSGTSPETVTARRQMLYPVVGGTGAMVGVITRTQLETATHHGRGELPVSELSHPDPVVAHPDDTLRAVVSSMAAHAVDRMPVTARDDHEHVVGMVSITMLLAARVRDLREARESERVLEGTDRAARPDDSAGPAGAEGSNGAPPGTRTPNPLIKSQLLCQLS